VKWQYRLVTRWRQSQYQERTNTYGSDDWTGDLGGLDGLNALGEAGWELVTVVPRSDIAGGNSQQNWAGWTSTELWVFKRPRP
jgi:hypothetical protein